MAGLLPWLFPEGVIILCLIKLASIAKHAAIYYIVHTVLCSLLHTQQVEQVVKQMPFLSQFFLWTRTVRRYLWTCTDWTARWVEMGFVGANVLIVFEHVLRPIGISTQSLLSPWITPASVVCGTAASSASQSHKFKTSGISYVRKKLQCK